MATFILTIEMNTDNQILLGEELLHAAKAAIAEMAENEDCPEVDTDWKLEPLRADSITWNRTE